MKIRATLVIFCAILGTWGPHSSQAQQSSNFFQVGWSTGGFAEAVAVVGDYAYVAAKKQLNVYDISDPTAPELIDSTHMFSIGSGDPVAQGIAVDAASGTLYLAVGAPGLWIYSLADPEHPVYTGNRNPGPVIGCRLSDDRLLTIVSPSFTQGSLVAYSLAIPQSPAWAGQFEQIDFVPYAAQKVGNTVYVMGIRIDYDLFWPQLKVLDATTGNYSQVAFAEYPWQGNVGDVLVDGSTVYLADGYTRVYVSEYTAPSTLTPVTDFQAPARSLQKVGNTLYAGGYLGLVGGGDFEAFDVADPNSITSIAAFQTPEWVDRMLVDGNTAYLPVGAAGLQILDLELLPQIDLLGHAWYPSSPWDLAYRDGTLFVADQQLLSLQWSGGWEPMPVVGRHDGGLTPKQAMASSPEGVAYVVDAGVTAVDTSDPTQLVSLGNVPPNLQTLDVTRWNTTVYAAQAYQGFNVIDFADPTDPQVLFTLSDQEVRVVEVWDGYLYLYGSDGGYGLKAFDVSSPGHPVEVWSYPTTIGGDGLVVSGGHLFATGSTGTAIYDLADPASPNLVTTIPCQDWARAIDVHGLHLYLGDGRFVRVYDLTDVANPVEVGYREMPNTVVSVERMENVVAVGVRDSGVHFLFFTIPTSTPPVAGNGISVTAWPNPIRARGFLGFELGWADDVRLDVFDVAGRRVRHWDRTVAAGEQTVIPWKGRDQEGRRLANGIYHYMLQSSRGSASGRVTILR